MQESGFNFIVGIGRSGTTLLMSMLNTHPAIQATPEVNFFSFFYDSWKNKTSFTQKDFEMLDDYVQNFRKRNHSSVFDWSIDLFKEYLNNAGQISFPVIYHCFYRSFIYANTSKNVTHSFDKNPINTLFLDDIIEQFPASKFVYLVRDPRANFLSRKEKIKARKANIYIDAQRWKIYNELALKAVEKYKDRFFILKYEDLVLDPAGCLKDLSVFFNFPYDESMLKFHLNVKEQVLKKINIKPEETHQKVRDKVEKLSKPVNTDRLNVWKEKLSKEEIEISSAICKVANKLNYDVGNNKPSYNFFKYYKGLFLAKRNILKEKIIYRLPLAIKLKLLNLVFR